MSPRRAVFVLLVATSGLLVGGCAAHHGSSAGLQPASVVAEKGEPLRIAVVAVKHPKSAPAPKSER